jgi:glycosyltransferase involved in cell wall biosynthesis
VVTGKQFPDRMVRILLIVTRMNIGGPAVQVSVLHRGLNSLGYECSLVCGTCEPGETELGGGPDDAQPVLRIAALSRSVNLLENGKALLRLWKLMRSGRPDVVHTHTAMAGCLGRIAAVCAGVPVIVHTFHGNSLTGYFSPSVNAILLRIERLLAKFTDTICVLSEQQLAELCGQFRIGPPNRFRVLPLGLDLSTFSALPPPPASEPLKVAWLGRLAPVKNVPLLLRAIEATLARAHLIEFHIAGDGPARNLVEQAARRFGSRVVWHGWVRELIPFLSKCHVLIQTSLNEGTPVALIQGMAAARPFVSTPAGGVVDMVAGPAQEVSDGCAWHSNGVLVNADPFAFAHALSELARDRRKLTAMGARARAFAMERYQQESLLPNLDRLYRDLLFRTESKRPLFKRKIAGAIS